MLIPIGDYLVVVPYNPRESVRRVLNRFELHPDDQIQISGTNKEFLTVCFVLILVSNNSKFILLTVANDIQSGHNGPITVYELIGTRVELATPASQRQVAFLASLATGGDAEKLKALAGDDQYKKEILGGRFSVIDLLEDYPSIKLTFSSFLDMLQPLAPRQYSISSSPLAAPAVPALSSQYQLRGDEDVGAKTSMTASLTYDVFTAEAFSGHGRQFNGVSSTYLSMLTPGSRLRCFVRKTNTPFRLPNDPKTPVIMVAAGTGIAPMRAFIQERASISASRPGGSEVLGPAVLYFGCRDFEEDFLYKEELAAWETQGVVKVRPAYSKKAPEGQSTSHVDQVIWSDREELKGMFADGARILVCGSAARLGRSTQDVFMRIYGEVQPEATKEEAQAWLLKQKEERYVSDVFG
jgi:cytochrome P450 / NADPH-cytochrome P450 reductase